MNSYYALAALALVACGQAVDNPATAALVAGPEAEQENVMSLAVDTLADLPACEKKNARQLAWVEGMNSFYHCKGGEWLPIELPAQRAAVVAGRDGKDGQGCTAKRVARGVEVSCGETTTLIEDGQAGERGEQGLAGADGVTTTLLETVEVAAPRVRVMQAGVELGTFQQVDASTNVVSFIHTSGARLQVRVDGTMWGEDQQFYYSGPDCTGAIKMSVPGYRFFNAAYEPNAGKWYRAWGSPARFDYASYARWGGACTNTSGYTLAGHETREAPELSGFQIGVALRWE